MRINQKKSKSKKWYFVSVAILFLIAGVVAYLFLDKTTPNEPDKSTDSVEVIDSVSEKEISEEQEPSSSYTEGKTPEQYNGQSENDADTNSTEFNNEQFRIPEEEL